MVRQQNCFFSLLKTGILTILFGVFCCSMAVSVAHAGTTDFQNIYMAANRGDIQQLRYLKSQGVDLDITEGGYSPYCLAAFYHNQLATHTLQLAGVNTDCDWDFEEVTESMIYNAADDRDVNQFAYWQKHGVFIDMTNEDGDTALCEAVYKNNCPAIDILIKAGASQYHPCLQRIPEQIRRSLNCQPVVRDWSKAGMTLLGLGLAAGGVAALSGSHSSDKMSPCGANEHWNGAACIRCTDDTIWAPSENACVPCPGGQHGDGTYCQCDEDQCWDGSQCLVLGRYQIIEGQHSSDDPELPFIYGRYRRAEDGTCQPIAPSPYLTSTDPHPTIRDFTDSTEFTAGLADIQAQYAYERGYTGKYVQRSDQYGNNPEITEESVKVGVLSTGLNTSSMGDLIPNQDIKNNIDEQRHNFDYGPCAEGQTQNCYGEYVTNTDEHYFVFYDADEKVNYINATTLALTAKADDYSMIPDDSVAQRYFPSDDYTGMRYDYDADYELSEDSSNDVNPHYRVAYDDTETPQQDSNGVGLAGIIAAQRNEKGIMGVAFDSKIIPAITDHIQPYGAGVSTEDNAVSVLKSEGATVVLQDYFVEPVYTLSGYTYLANEVKGHDAKIYYPQAELSAYDTLKKQDKNTTYSAGEQQATVLVLPTGNFAGNNYVESGSGIVSTQTVNDASISVGAPLTKTYQNQLNDVLVAVTGVISDSTAPNGYVLHPDALPCGSAAGYCLSAPAIMKTLNTATTDSPYATQTLEGTSPAAATVAGAIALMQGAYPHLSSPEIMKILYQTATPLGALAVENASVGTTLGSDTVLSGKYGKYSKLYGYGLINLRAATEPVGALWIPGTNTSAASLMSNTRLTLGASNAKLLSAVPNVAASDDYGRSYSVSLANNIAVQKADSHDFQDDFNAFMQGRDKTLIQTNDQFSMAYAPRRSYRYSHMNQGLMEMNMNFGPSEWNLFYTEDMMTSRGKSYFEHVLNNPLLQIQDAHGFESSYHFNDDWTIMGGYVSGKNGFLGDGDKGFKAPENRISAYHVGMAYQPVRSVAFKTAYGMMDEQDSVLGMMGDGIFDIKGASTAFISTGLTLRPMDKFKLDLMYTYGWTNPQRANGMMQFSRLTSDGFAVAAQYEMDENQMIGFSVSSPLRVRSGMVSFDVPAGRDMNGFYRQVYTGNLKPTARELAFALYYKDNLSDNLMVQSEVGMRLHPDHLEEAKNDYRGLFALTWKY